MKYTRRELWLYKFLNTYLNIREYYILILWDFKLLLVLARNIINDIFLFYHIAHILSRLYCYLVTLSLLSLHAFYLYYKQIC